MQVTFNGGGGTWTGDCDVHDTPYGYTKITLTFDKLLELAKAMGQEPYERITVTADGVSLEPFKIWGKK